jgi:hypothetical protein
VWRTQRRYHADGSPYAWLVRASAFINFFYFYCVDADFGPFFLKFSTYFPFTAKLCINGNEWAKRQAAKAGIRRPATITIDSIMTAAPSKPSNRHVIRESSTSRRRVAPGHRRLRRRADGQ